ncbi:MAG: hypothetical protein HZA72_01175 [Candidatus Omnitrophica bacterium]|nr:hypothetical protein [Candidatus Omnitrophota bacterium]
MSQRRDAILLIEKAAGLKGLILRPLSAKLFEPTIPEKEGIIGREKLLDIRGRSRKPQIALAKEFAMFDYPCPAGGCLLTDPGFAKRMKDLLEHSALTIDNVKLLKYGRHFRVSKDTKLVVGRDEEENDILESLVKPDDVIFKLKDHEGPISILRSRSPLRVTYSVDKCNDLIKLGASIAAYHTKFRNEEAIAVNYWDGVLYAKATISAGPADLSEIEKLRI